MSKYALRDRYSQAFGLLLIGIILSLALRKSGKAWIVGLVIGLSGLAYMVFLLSRPGGRVIILDRTANLDDIFWMKLVGKCQYVDEWPEVTDAITHPEGKIFKINNGVDVVVENREIKEAGFGSLIINRIGAGGYIEPDDCYRFNPWKGQGSVLNNSEGKSLPEDVP